MRALLPLQTRGFTSHAAKLIDKVRTQPSAPVLNLTSIPSRPPEHSNGHSAELAHSQDSSHSTRRTSGSQVPDDSGSGEPSFNIWNLSPRSPRTPVRERGTPLPPDLDLSRARPTIPEYEPTTPTPLPQSQRIKRLPALDLDAAALERWFHTGKAKRTRLLSDSDEE